ncbi:MAG: VWA domain-containing protein [Chloroflexi bacterium]|nr:VWA domain-containing protein [Chloroflexota bacterium]MCC6893786.1 VWA domain-containing protein [Anaerolineae bacterium]
MSLLTPIALLGGLLAIPIILLYMLRLRRREVVVSSTFLWQQIVRDNEANTPWQRLRRNLLLLLQLIILALIVLALARPFITVPAVSTGKIELLLDASASMQATDMTDGSSRFEAAKRQALGIVDTMGQNDAMTIIRVADVPEVIAASTSDPIVLRAAINGATASDAEADWVGAITLASADAINVSDFNMIVISDGGLGDASGLPGVPGTVEYIPIGQSNDNLAITALATRALPGQPPQLFAQVTNYGSQDTPVIFDLRVDGELYKAERYVVAAGSSLPVVSATLPDSFTVLQAGLTTPSDSQIPDYLAVDNTAWTISSGNSNRRALLMTENNRFLEQVLRSVPTIEAFKGDTTRPLPADPYDLYILDGWLPPDGLLPDGDLLIIDPPSSTAFFTVGSEVEPSGAINVQPNDPRTTFVDFADVNILKFNTLSGVDWAEPLVTLNGEPLLLAGEQDGRQIAILTFDIHDSDLPLQITWPILMSNLLEWFTPSSIISVPNGLQVGDSLPIRPPFDATNVRVTLPDGITRDLPIERETIVFADTQAAGVYTVDILKAGEAIQSAPFAVNIFAANESNITPQPTISLNGSTISAATRDEVGQQEFWPWVAALALAILMIEWLVYQRRMHTRTLFQPIFRQPAQGVAR